MTRRRGDFCLRVTVTRKSWSFVYRPKGSGKQKRYTIGDYPTWSLGAARDKALAMRRAVQDGGDPVAVQKTAPLRLQTSTRVGLIQASPLHSIAIDSKIAFAVDQVGTG